MEPLISRHLWEAERVSIAESGHLWECATTEFVWEFPKTGFCEGGSK